MKLHILPIPSLITLLLLIPTPLSTTILAATPPTSTIKVFAHTPTLVFPNINITLTPYDLNNNPDTPITQKTNNSGLATFPNQPLGRYDISASYTNYQEAKSSILLQQGETLVEQDLLLQPTTDTKVLFKIEGTSTPVKLQAKDPQQGLLILEEIQGPGKEIMLKEGNWIVEASSLAVAPIQLSLSIGPKLENQIPIPPTEPIEVQLYFSTHRPTPVDSETSLDCSMLAGHLDSIPLSLIAVAILGLLLRIRRKTR